VLFPSLAGAHANIVKGESACADASGTYTVTWTISNDYAQAETVGLTVTGGGTLSATPLDILSNGTGQVTQSGIPGGATSASLTAVGTWTDTFTMTVSNSVQFVGPCPSTVTPATPTVAPVVCTAPGQPTPPKYTIPTTTGVNYLVGGATVLAGDHPMTQGASVTITAQPQTGYSLKEGAQASWTLTANVNNCITDVTPVAPTITQATCNLNTPGDATVPQYTIPTTTGVTYKVGGVVKQAGSYDLAQGSSVIITAEAQTGYSLKEGAQASWTLTANVKDCTVHVTVTPSVFGNETCVNRASVAGTLVITATTGVTYTVSPASAITELATVNAGSATINAGSYHVIPSVTVTVTAVASPGYTIDSSTTFPHTYPVALDCTEHVTPLTPTYSVQQCLYPAYTVQPATVTIPSTTGVVYSLDGTVTPAGTVTVAVGSHAVTAASVEGYTLDSYSVSGWTATITAVPCEYKVLAAPPIRPVLASTGTDSANLAILGVLVLLAGGGLLALTTRRRSTDTEA
jgi:LPXTG-motif cell wall-anchored protein